MSDTLLAKITETRSRFQEGAVRRPQVFFRTNSPSGQERAKEIMAILNGPETRTVTAFLRAHGVARIDLAQLEKGTLESRVFTRANIPDLSRLFAPYPITEGNAGMVFGPRCRPTTLEIERQCWRLYLDSACPELGREFRQLGKALKASYAGLAVYFLTALADCYLRSAALAAERAEFAADDAEQALTGDLAHLAKLPAAQLNYFTQTAAVAGLTLNYALPFYHDHKKAYAHFAERISRYTEHGIGQDGNLEVVFERAQQMAAVCYRACYGKKENGAALQPGALRTEGFGMNIYSLWADHIQQYFGGILTQQ